MAHKISLEVNDMFVPVSTCTKISNYLAVNKREEQKDALNFKYYTCSTVKNAVFLIISKESRHYLDHQAAASCTQRSCFTKACKETCMYKMFV